MNLQELLKLRRDLFDEDDVLVMRYFRDTVEYNEKTVECPIEHDYIAIEKACDNLEDLLKRCRWAIESFIPSLKPIDKDMVFSIRQLDKPPFITRTNDPAVIEKLYHIFIKVGGTDNVKFLLKNLRLNEDDKNAE